MNFLVRALGLGVLTLGLLLSVTPVSTLLAQEQVEQTPPLPRPRPDREGAAASGQAEAPIPATPRTLSAATPATEAISALTSVPRAVRLTARIVEDGPPVPDGLVWRIFDTKTDESGQLAMVAKSDEADVNIELPPGEYVVHVAYGRAQASDALVVDSDVNEKAIILEAGGLRLNAAVTGDVEIPINLLHFTVFAGSGGDNNRTSVVENLAPNDIVTLNAGTYHIVSYFGAVNAVVRADLRVEPGQITEATLYHHAAQVAFKLVSEAGGEAIADVDWTVKTAAGDTVFTDIGAFPATALAEGDYTLLAKRGAEVYNRDFEVLPGLPRDIEVLTSVY